MARLLNYILFLVGLFCFFILIVPFGLYERGFSEIGGYDCQDLTKLYNFVKPGYFIGGSLSSAIIFCIAATVTLFLQQFFWIKKVNKFNDFPVPVNLIKKYMNVMYTGVLTILVSISWFLIAWLLPIQNISPSDKNSLFSFYETRKWVYIAGIIVCGLIGLVTVGLSSYYSLLIAYDQQKQLVDQGIKDGTYDPETRMPYDNNTTISENTIVEQKQNQKENQDFVGSSGLVQNGE